MKNIRFIIISILSVLFSQVAYSQNTTPAPAPGTDLESSISVYDKFDYEDAYNWSDCFGSYKIKLKPFAGFCPGKFGWRPYPPYPSPGIEWSYNEPIAIVEVVPDPWRSYLYNESFFDFSGRSKDAMFDRISATPTMGGGYGNQRNSSTGKDFIGKQKYDTHVWAVSDWWRIKSNFTDGCLSLTCRNSDMTGCLMSTVNTIIRIKDSLKETMKSISDLGDGGGGGVEGKGNGIVNGETGEVSYENGEVYKPKIDPETGDVEGYDMIREPGNYGSSMISGNETLGKMAEVGMSESPIPGMTNAELLQDSVEFGMNPQGYVIGAAMESGSDVIFGQSDAEIEQEKNKEAYFDSISGDSEGWDFKETEFGQFIGDTADSVKNSDIAKAIGGVTEGVADTTQGWRDNAESKVDGWKSDIKNSSVGQSVTETANSISDSASGFSEKMANSFNYGEDVATPEIPDETKRLYADPIIPPTIGDMTSGSTFNSMSDGARYGTVTDGDSSYSFKVEGNQATVSTMGQEFQGEALGQVNGGSVPMGNEQAKGDVEGFLGGTADAISMAALSFALSLIDRVTYFNVVELVIQMIATVMPVALWPVFMTENHPKASKTGGFFWSDMFGSFADAGAGLVMPLFCMSKILGMSVDGVAGLLGNADFSVLGSLGKIGSFIESRCVGSWGPLEPRVNIFGTGDPYVAAGLASVRALNIAQSVTGSLFNKTINNTPYSALKFNLAWPHESDCYGFQGSEGLSRAWTSPIGSALDGVSDAVKSGDMSNLAGAALDASPVGQARKAGGYVFSYWAPRKCSLLLFCWDWKGTGV